MIASTRFLIKGERQLRFSPSVNIENVFGTYLGFERGGSGSSVGLIMQPAFGLAYEPAPWHVMSNKGLFLLCVWCSDQ